MELFPGSTPEGYTGVVQGLPSRIPNRPASRRGGRSTPSVEAWHSADTLPGRELRRTHLRARVPDVKLGGQAV